ncbi:16S rRNA (cytidine(1402)-2'-O)-methyltransferase [bacterium]|nr:16S rRNA (cytidine(1402)-2'-O)-methyltransferase [bacterium]
MNTEADRELQEPSKTELKPHTLYLVGVPIGNLGDFTPRAADILRRADYIACEEVQASRRLLNALHLEVKGTLISYRESGREASGSNIADLLKQGKTVAVISGAGMPGISDPGRDLVLKCHQEGLGVSPVPGASALTAAAASCGLPTRRFAFEGFLPRGDGDRQKFLATLAREERTMLFFEAPHRVLSTLQALREAFGNRRAFVGRELTKYFEECVLADLEFFCEKYRETEPRGEFVIAVEGLQEDETAKALEAKVQLEADCEFLKDLDISAKDKAAILGYFRDIPKNKAKQAVMGK